MYAFIDLNGIHTTKGSDPEKQRFSEAKWYSKGMSRAQVLAVDNSIHQVKDSKM